jgi:hypothetical protein
MNISGGFNMRELVGSCSVCKKDVYCLDGFLNGSLDEQGRLACFECAKDEKDEKESRQGDQD